MNLIVDLETDGLLDTVSKIWCIGTINATTGEEILFDYSRIAEGIEYLEKAKMLVFHNMRYDLEVFKKLYNIDWYSKTLDTLIMFKIEDPFLLPIKGVTNQPYSLKAFGHRFKFPKGDHSDWTRYSEEMGEYCLQDCRVTLRAVQHLSKRGYDFFSGWNKIEHSFAMVQQKAVNKGVWFDQDLQQRTLSDITTRMFEIDSSVSDILGYSYQDFEYVLKDVNIYKTRTVKGERIKEVVGTRTKEEQWTPSARIKYNNIKLEFPTYKLTPTYEGNKVCFKYPVKVTLDTKLTLVARLQELGWKPVFYTDPSETHPKGQPQLTRKAEVDPNLEKMGDEYKEFPEYFMLKHRMGLISGFSNLLRPDGRIPADADTVGTVTGRVAHRGVANFPRVSTPYGKVIRGMFGVQPGTDRVLIGSDLAGIEARLLAHYMNDAEFTHEVLNGDIHSKNQEAAGLPTRDDAKTFIYAFMYGAGDAKIGEIIGGNAKDGQAIKKKFLSNLPSLAKVIKDKQKEGATGTIRIIGNRPVRLTKSKGRSGSYEYDVRKSLNSSLQGSGAIYFKKWAVDVDKLFTEEGLDAVITILYHDEVQIDCAVVDQERAKEILTIALHQADDYFKVNCPNAIETKVGQTWEDTH